MKQIYLLTLIVFVSGQLFAVDYPNTKKIKVIDEYHGVKVEDNYQWLENWDDKVVKNWSSEQNVIARNYLDPLPYRELLSAQIQKIRAAKVESYYSGSKVGDKAYFIKSLPPKQQPFLIEIDQSGDKKTEKNIFDPNVFDKTGSTTIDWYCISPDGKLVALALSKGGSEISDLSVIDIQSGKQIDNIIPRVNAPTAGGDIVWMADSSGFYYTRYPREEERKSADMNFYQQLWFHQLGTKLNEDSYEIGRDFSRINELKIKMEPVSGQLLLTMQFGDSGKFQLYLRQTDGKWLQLSDYDSKIVQAEFVTKDQLLILSRQDAPKGKLLIWDISKTVGPNKRLVVPESDVTLASNFYGDPTFIVHNKKIFATVLDGGPSYIRVYSLFGEQLATPKLPPVSGVGQLIPWGDNHLMIRQYSYVSPNKWLRLNIEKNDLFDMPLSSSSPVNFDDAIVLRKYATSKDGTKVPVTIIHGKDVQLDGKNPLLLTGYGGYGISLRPFFTSTISIWLEQGGIFAIANLRGGGEYGEEWHQQGMLTHKQNVFDDFAGVMSYLIEQKYTSSKHLAIEGGSNGGLLMGAMITQHPDLFATTISHVGIYDSLRSELDANGEFNIPEFGTVKDAAQFKALYAYSPYHHVVQKNLYPSILFMTGENDGRVNPFHSRKMTAILQAANASDNPILLRTSGSTGHGSGTPLSEAIAQDVDRFSFLFNTLNMKYHYKQ